MRSFGGSKVSCARWFGLVSLTVTLFVVFGAGQGWARWYTNKSLKHHKKVKSNSCDRSRSFSASVGDQLHLRGVLLKVDKNEVTVQVLSESCAGKHKFLVKDPKLLQYLSSVYSSSKASKRIVRQEVELFFSIDSSTCRGEAPIYIVNINGMGESVGE